MKAQVIVFLPSIQNGILVPGIGVAKLEHLGNKHMGRSSQPLFLSSKQTKQDKKKVLEKI